MEKLGLWSRKICRGAFSQEFFDTSRHPAKIWLFMPDPQHPAAVAETTQQRITTEDIQTSYVNFCRGTLTPEEVVLDLGFNANSFGVKVLEEDLEIKNRVILSPAAAKRLLLLLNDMVHRHEQNFGTIEVDFRRRIKAAPDSTNSRS
jgi:hypothetical protein